MLWMGANIGAAAGAIGVPAEMVALTLP